MGQEENKTDKTLDMHRCRTTNCGYIYNSEKGDRKGKVCKDTLFCDLPEEWKCPVCGATKKSFDSML